jgi:predicted Rossmann fold nucleotide-binding protein DprA/Smf involved in DNA uptake
MINIAVVGSRNFMDYDTVCMGIIETLDLWKININQVNSIISGGAPGIDSSAEIFAKYFDIKFVVFEADWSKYGKSVGPKRNSLIVKHATHVIAFVAEDSVGTLDTIRKARESNLTINIITV